MKITEVNVSQSSLVEEQQLQGPIFNLHLSEILHGIVLVRPATSAVRVAAIWYTGHTTPSPLSLIAVDVQGSYVISDLTVLRIVETCVASLAFG